MGEAIDLLVVKLAKGKLDRSPKHNWVEDAGGLPPFIEDMASHIHDKGKDISTAIAIAVSQTKKLAAKGNRRAAQALAQWEALKAKNKAKTAAKKG